jgi:small subunit ribosomal protein S17
MTGVVTSNKMEKTVSVQISRRFRHRLYKKVVDRHTSVKAHDELGCEIGDQVLIVESKPISKTKRWAVEEILRKTVSAQQN